MVSPSGVFPAAAQTAKAVTPQSQQDLQAQWAEYYRMAGAYYQQPQPQGGAPDGQGIHNSDVRPLHYGGVGMVRCCDCVMYVSLWITLCDALPSVPFLSSEMIVDVLCLSVCRALTCQDCIPCHIAHTVIAYNKYQDSVRTACQCC